MKKRSILQKIKDDYIKLKNRKFSVKYIDDMVKLIEYTPYFVEEPGYMEIENDLINAFLKYLSSYHEETISTYSKKILSARKIVNKKIMEDNS